MSFEETPGDTALVSQINFTSSDKTDMFNLTDLDGDDYVNSCAFQPIHHMTPTPTHCTNNF